MVQRRLLTRFRYDETLYSAFARASAYLGSPPRARLHDAVLGTDVTIFDDLPVGLARVVASGAFGEADVYGAVREWTLFPYHAHYAPIDRARSAERRMEGEGQWPHEPLGCGTSAPERLRFCRSCRADMLEQHGDAWWRRTHQLPSSLVCSDHAEALLASAVTRERRKTAYLPASDAECRDDAPMVAVIDGGYALTDLTAVARAGDRLLDNHGEVHPDDRREGYLQRLDRLRMLNRVGEARLPAVAGIVEARWGETLGRWPGLARDGRCRQGWLGALLMGAHGSPPLHHILFEGALAWAEGRR